MIFRSLFNCDWKTAAQTQKFKFPVVFCLILHPAWRQGVKVIEIRITNKTALFEMILRANTPVCIDLKDVQYPLGFALLKESVAASSNKE